MEPLFSFISSYILEIVATFAMAFASALFSAATVYIESLRQRSQAQLTASQQALLDEFAATAVFAARRALKNGNISNAEAAKSYAVDALHKLVAGQPNLSKYLDKEILSNYVEAAYTRLIEDFDVNKGTAEFTTEFTVQGTN